MAGRNRATDTSGDEMTNLEEHIKKLNLTEKRDVNILLLGETGVGKSTFINAFCNYLRYPTLKHAMKGKLTTLIPTKFTITDENFEIQDVHVGADANEFVEVGVSATQSSRSYVFPIRKGNMRVRLIDTPGVGDTRGIDQDNINFENILSFIGELKHLNAICILLKPNNPRLTVMFEFCIKQLLSRLEKSASQNLIFVFTNSRNTFYRPGETLPALKKLLGNVQSVNINLNKDNIFCTDNEAFRFLAAASNGIKFSHTDVDNFAQSWKNSFRECWRMITYIAGDANKNPLTPHLVKNTISVNEARRLIVQLSQPLAEIAQLIQDNITILKRHKTSLEIGDNTLADLKTKLYIPIVDLQIIPMSRPTTICTSQKCSEVYQVGDRQKWHYRQKCHSPCYLTNVPKEIIGSPDLVHCAAMSNMMCKECSCSYLVHMHIYYETKTFLHEIEDTVIKSEIHDKRSALLVAKRVVAKIELRLKEYGEERDIIINTTAKFAHFLQANAITPYNDSYQAYLHYLIDRERSMGVSADQDMIKEFNKMLLRYNEEKNALNHALSHSTEGGSITADEIIRCVESLYGLKHNGLKIRELFNTQKKARKDENKYEGKEYVHVLPGKKKNKKKKKKNKNPENNDTTDSEYATDAGQNRNRNYNQRGFNNRNQYFNQRGRGQYHNQGYNQYQKPFQQQPSEMQKNQPVQFLHVKQGPTGQFDLRFGHTNPDQQGYSYSQNPRQFHAQHSAPPYYQGNQYGAYPKAYGARPLPPPPPPYENSFQHNQWQPQNNRGRPGHSNFNNQGPQNYNRSGHYQPPQNSQFPYQNVNTLSQGPKHFDRKLYNKPANQGLPKSVNQSKPTPLMSIDQMALYKLLQDSGCESAGSKHSYGKNSNRSGKKMNFQDDSSSSSSSFDSSSSEDESYQTCHK